MDRETAESYVLYGIKATVFKKSACVRLMALNLIVLAISLFLFREVYYIAVCAAIAVAAVVTLAVFCKKWSAFCGLMAQATQFSILVLVLDCIYFAMFQYKGAFDLLSYAIAVIIQVIAFAISLILVVQSARHYDKNKKPAINTTAGAISGAACIVALVLSRIFLKNASHSAALTVLSVLFNLLVILLSYVVVMAYYRAFLIKKFRLTIDLNNL